VPGRAPSTITIPELEPDPLSPSSAAAGDGATTMAPGASTKIEGPSRKTPEDSTSPFVLGEARSESSGSQRTIGFITGGVGLALTGVGIGFAIATTSRLNEATALCPGNVCAPGNVQRHDALTRTARTDRTISIIGIGIGGAASIIGIVLVLTTPVKASAGLHVYPVLERTSAGIAVGSPW
jgi:hypothetical protein